MILPAVQPQRDGADAVLRALPLEAIPLHALLLLISIGVLLGFQTRILAPMGAALFLALFLSESFAALPLWQGALLIAVVPILTVPLVFADDDGWSFFPGSWDNQH
ncbi:hypothetical protein [Actibacterium sp. D379-3]